MSIIIPVHSNSMVSSHTGQQADRSGSRSLSGGQPTTLGQMGARHSRKLSVSLLTHVQIVQCSVVLTLNVDPTIVVAPSGVRHGQTELPQHDSSVLWPSKHTCSRCTAMIQLLTIVIYITLRAGRRTQLLRISFIALVFP